jgi:hypothetical protein
MLVLCATPFAEGSGPNGGLFPRRTQHDSGADGQNASVLAVSSPLALAAIFLHPTHKSIRRHPFHGV